MLADPAVLRLIPNTAQLLLMRMRSYSAAAILLLAACGKETTAPPKPASITISVTGTITGVVNSAVIPTPMFTVLDDKGMMLSNVAVTIAVTSGGGSIASAATKSGAAAAAVGVWTLGASPGLNTLTITVAGLAPVVISANGRPAYFVDLRFFGPPIDPAFQAAFQAAANRVMAIITGDVPDVPLTAFDISGCDITGVGPLTEIVDDIIIYATVKEIDGVGKVLGSSGPCFTRTAGGLSLIGVMNFDVADFQTLKNDGRLNDVVLHEMLHTIGFGTLWLSKGQISGAGTAAPAFVGAQAVAGCLAAGGATVCPGTVPLETTGGPGTRDVHWRETTFRTELMTGFISAPGTVNPVSRMSIASLFDLGYTVNTSVADAYTVPSSTAAAFGLLQAEIGADGSFALNDIVREPIGSVDTNGRMTMLSARIK